MYKITTTFDFMKKGRNIVVYIIFLLVVLFCSPITANSNAEAQPSFPELSETGNNIEDSIFQDTDSSDEDQLDQTFKTGIREQHECQITYLFILPLFDNMFSPVWQPPKIF